MERRIQLLSVPQQKSNSQGLAICHFSSTAGLEFEFRTVYCCLHISAIACERFAAAMPMAPIQLCFFALLLFIFSKIIMKPLRKRQPPGPLALPVIGHLHLLGPALHRSFHSLSTRYGPLFSVRMGSIRCVVASSPEFVKVLLKTHDANFAARSSTLAIDCVTYNSSFSFSASDRPYWRFIKKLIAVELFGSRTLAQFLPVRAEELRQLTRTLSEKARACESVNVTDELMKYANNVISQMMLSIRCCGVDNDGGQQQQGEECRALAREVTEIFGKFNVSDVIWIFRNFDLQGFQKRFKDIHCRYDTLLEKIISGREDVRKKKKKKTEEEAVKDLLDLLLDVLENQEMNSEIQFTREHIKSLVLEILTAGTDSSAMAVEWALAELLNNPEVLRKAQQEIDQVVGRNKLVQESDVPRLPYIQAVLKESLRIHPVIPLISRKAIQDCKINNYVIPQGTVLFVNAWSMGRDPGIWENPLEFRPERFLMQSDSESEIDVKGFHYQLLPFGTGRRGCPGFSLAMQELPTTLAAMIQCFDWKVQGTRPDGMIDMSERPGLTAPRAHDLVCVPVARCTIVF